MTSRWGVLHGDVLAFLACFADNTFDALLSDPPYGLKFMGKRWDVSVPGVEVWTEVLRVLKPGAPILVFGGTRTFHRLAVAIEDAGFELRDTLAWMYGSGFPKSLDVSKAIDAAAGAVREVVGDRPYATRDGRGIGNAYGEVTRTSVTAPATPAAARWSGYGTALKPAWEPIILARKPLDGTVAENVQRWGTGGLAIDACRIGRGEDKTPAPVRRIDSAPGFSSTKEMGGDDEVGRWPANVMLDEEAAAVLDEQTGRLDSHGGVGVHAGGNGFQRGGTATYRPIAAGDSGGGSRFFYVAKADRLERELGCERLPKRSAAEVTESEEGATRLDCPRTGAGRTSGARNHHPTVKPIALLRELARLTLPPPRDGDPRRILIPYAGSGSEAIGAVRAGWDRVDAIEREFEYVHIARNRLLRWQSVPERVDDVKRVATDDRQADLFASGAR